MNWIIDKVEDNFPSYGKWCGYGRTANDDKNATIDDVPVDSLDCLGWLHDKEIGVALTFSGFNLVKALNTANLNWVSRSKKLAEVTRFSIEWWSTRLNKSLSIPEKWDADHVKLYKPGSVRLFKFLSIEMIPYLKDQSLLRNAIDEAFVGRPPV